MSAVNPAQAPQQTRPVPPPNAGMPQTGGLRDNPTVTKALLIVGGVLATALTFRNNEGLRGLVAISMVGILYFLIFASPGLGVSGMILFLSLVGGVRRWMIPFVGYSNMDPLLLVNPIIIALFIASILVQKKVPRETRMERLVLYLSIVMAVEVINPFQGGMAVGVAGTLFYMVPLLWFYIGRVVGSPRVQRKVLNTVVVVGLAAGAYGLYQQWFGFLPSEMEWLKITKMLGGMGVGRSSIRVFAFFTSFSEYVYFLCLGAMISWAMFLRGNRPMIIPFLFLVGGVFLSSSRGALVSVLFAIAMLWSVQGRTMRSWIPRLALALVLGTAGMAWSLQEIKSSDIAGPASDLLGHQTQLLDPFSAKSTGSGHASLFLEGILSGFTNPLGRGLGATTIAAGKFGGTGGGTEVDISNLFSSLGFIGGILYVLLIAQVFLIVARQWLILRDMRSLAIIGILAVSLGQWLNGGHYAAATLIWFMIGGLNRINKELQAQGRIPPEPVKNKPILTQSQQLGIGPRPAPAASGAAEAAS